MFGQSRQKGRTDTKILPSRKWSCPLFCKCRMLPEGKLTIVIKPLSLKTTGDLFIAFVDLAFNDRSRTILETRKASSWKAVFLEDYTFNEFFPLHRIVRGVGRRIIFPWRALGGKMIYISRNKPLSIYCVKKLVWSSDINEQLEIISMPRRT